VNALNTRAGGAAAILTSAPIQSSSAIDAEFVDILGAKARWSLGRSLIYDALSRHEIESICLRRPGKLRGKRLLNVASIKRWLASMPTDIDPKISKHCRQANHAMQIARRAKEGGEEGRCTFRQQPNQQSTVKIVTDQTFIE